MLARRKKLEDVIKVAKIDIQIIIPKGNPLFPRQSILLCQKKIR